MKVSSKWFLTNNFGAFQNFVGKSDNCVESKLTCTTYWPLILLKVQ